MRSAIAWAIALLGAVLAAGCPGGPCQGAECAATSVSSGNFIPGALPHSALQLEGERCGRSSPQLQIFLSNLFTQPDPPAAVHVADLLTVYWSVCNLGNTDTVSPSMPGAYDFVVTRTSDMSEVRRESLDAPQLQGCSCQVVSRQFNGGSGAGLAAGVYEFSLARLFDADVNRVISE